MRATIGRIVHYRLTDADAERMNKRRADYRAFATAHAHGPDTAPPTGHVAHVGNRLEAGDYYPAMVVRTGLSPDSVNLQVFLDGTDQLWATSAKEGDGNGTWTWPPSATNPPPVVSEL
jgi:hypothetical protein